MSSNSTSTSIAHHHVESAMEENVRAIKAWEYRARHARTRAEALSDWITAKAASGPVLVIHVIWFAAWIAVNAGAIRGIAPFDPFPFPFLTMAVSLEAIFLALFVLASQNRLARQADKRENLDLQIDLLAEREMTAVLHLLRDIASHFQIETTVTPNQIRDLVKKTDLQELTNKVEELSAEDDTSRDERPDKPATQPRPAMPGKAKAMRPPGGRAWRRTHSTS
jgi:uncharacterized membrane protein